MKNVIIAAALAFSAPAMAAESLGPLVSPVALHAALGEADPLILDIRDAGPTGYAGGHLPGAVSAPYKLFRGPRDNPGRVPEAAMLTATLSELGVETDRPVVITHQGSDATDFGAAARVYWTLKSSGVEAISILNGGVRAWRGAGFDLDTAPVTPDPSLIEVRFSERWMADAAAVREVIGGEAEALLLDARPEAFWRGEVQHKAAARPGTLPQSRYFSHAGWFGDGPLIVDAQAAAALAQEAGLTQEAQVISFCNTGHWAATNWFALSELAGIQDVKLYPESMVGWSQQGGEMMNTPGMLRNLLNQVTGAFSG